MKIGEDLHQITSHSGDTYRFSKKDILGKGGFSAIFKGKNMRTNEEVAIKHIKPVRLTAGLTPLRHETEVAALRKLLHNPSIIRYIDHVKYRNWMFIVTEYRSDFVDLYDFFTMTRQPDKVIWAVFLRLVTAVKEMEDEGIFHGDLKCSNVLISNLDQSIRVIDFGLCKKYEKNAKVFERPRLPESLLPPEWFKRCEITMGPWSAWQLGTVLFFLVHKRYPFVSKEHVLGTITKATFERRVGNPLTKMIKLLLADRVGKRPEVRDIHPTAELLRKKYKAD